MFAGSIARRLLGRRRSFARLETDDFSDLDDMLDALRWRGESMSWTTALPGANDEELGHRFVVDCPLLRCREPWFAIEAYGVELETGPEAIIVVPGSLTQAAHRNIARIDVALDRSCPPPDNLAGAVQSLLEAGYLAAFDGGM